MRQTMFWISTLFPVLIYSQYVTSSLIASNGSCPQIQVCKPFQIVSLRNDTDSSAVEALKLRADEQLVAQLGHIEGLQPESYDLVFTFRNKTHYEGSVNILVTAKEATNQIVLNRQRKVPEIDYEKIQIDSACDEGRSKAMGCIEKVLVLNDSFVLQLSKRLEAYQKYIIRIPNFRSQVYDELTESGSVGLASSGGQESGYWALTTIFQMRYARSVFPCFDHPSLKAKFQVCLQHPPGWMAATNTPVSTQEKMKNSQLVRSCFLETPPISTYVFTIAVMENYTHMALADKNPVLDLFCPQSKIGDLNWIPYTAKRALQAMQQLTNTTYPLPKLSFYVVYPAPFWGIENLGLIALEGTFMEEGESGNKAALILNHEVIHQWIGDTVTISSWREICIQEGLTAFLEWKLSQDLQNVSMKGQLEEAIGGYRTGYPPFLTQYNRTQDIADRCFGLPPAFFKTIYDYYGVETFKKFLNKLVTQGRYDNVNVTVMDKILVDATKDRNLDGYLQSWFGQPGFATLFISVPNDREIQIVQGEVQNFEEVVTNNKTTRPFPLKISTSNGHLIIVTLPKQQNYTVPLGKAADNKNVPLVLVDPDHAILARKFYELKSYQKFLCTENSTDCDHKFLTSKRVELIWIDFCRGLILDAFPWGHDNTKFDKDGWSALFKNALSAKVLERGLCRCCVGTEEENKKKKGCFFGWEQTCRKLRINQMLGQNYTLPQGSPFWRPGGEDDS